MSACTMYAVNFLPARSQKYYFKKDRLGGWSYLIEMPGKKLKFVDHVVGVCVLGTFDGGYPRN